MDLKTLLQKPVENLTIEEVRLLLSNVKDFMDKYALFQFVFGDLNASDYNSLVINNNTLTVNGDNLNSIEIDSVFREFLIQTILDAMQNRKDSNVLKETQLANRIIEINNV